MLYKDLKFTLDSEREQVRQLRAKGIPYTKIRSDYFPNTPLSTLETYALHSQGHKHSRPWSDEEFKKLHALREKQKLPVSEVARALNRSYFSVRDVLRKIRARNFAKRADKWDRDARKRAIDMIQCGIPLEKVATFVYPHKDLDVACKYLRKMYKNFMRRKG